MSFASSLKRPPTSRADLLRALERNDSMLTAAMAELLGYEYDESRARLRGLKYPRTEHETPSQEQGPESTPPSSIYHPPLIPFWRLETFEAVAPLVEVPLKDESSIPGARIQRRQPTRSSGFVPLGQKREILTELRKVDATRRLTKDIDVDAVVDRVSQGYFLAHLPHRQRRAWGSSILIIKDRARRLTPYWQDQDYIVNILQTLYPPSGVTIARIEDGERHPTIRWPQELYGQPVSPLPGTIILVLSDLGCLAPQGEQVQQLWLSFGLSLREQHVPAVALVPAKLTDISPQLAHTWTIARWGTASGTSAESSSSTQTTVLEHLLTLLSPAVRIEPGLLRTIRCVFPEGHNDPGLEARVWQDTAIASQHSVAASWDPRAREAYLKRFAEQPKRQRDEILQIIQSWRINLPPMVAIEELSWLDENSRKLVTWKSAVTTLMAYAKELRYARYLSPLTVAWIIRFLERSPSHTLPDPQMEHMEQVRHNLFDLVRSHEAVTQVYAWVNPARLSAPRQSERRVLLWQAVDQLLVRTGESSSSMGNDAGVRGSPLGVVHTASGEVLVAIGEPQPEKNDFWRNGQPPSWARDWGWDEFGAWVMFRVDEVEQRLRWIPPGQFLMGSPKNEKGRDSDEGPQHEVYLTRGFWLFETPCTQALWQVVMGQNPSDFKGATRPVEQVSWEDCQHFIGKLNDRLPGLHARLPTEAQWEYACRAGTSTARYEDDIDAIAWYYENSNDETHPVKQKRANAWGLYDMLGNVWEWCRDGLREYLTTVAGDPLGPTTAAASRALRGGSWNSGAQRVRAADRVGDPPDRRYGSIGFRCASSIEYQPGQRGVAWRASERKAEPAEPASRYPEARLLDLNQQAQISFALPRERVLYLNTDRDRLRMRQVTLPSWAREIGRDEYGLWVEFEVEKVRQRMRWIPPGRFWMGSPGREEGRYDYEGPQHEVRLTQGFWLFDTPCTQALWQTVMRTNPSAFPGKPEGKIRTALKSAIGIGKKPSHLQDETRPVETVRWEECQTFMRTLSALLPGITLSLPTEAEWEYACRGGTTTARYDEDVDTIAWYFNNSKEQTHPVKQKRANAWGLYDMLGNVWEWCHDGLRTYTNEWQVDPLGPLDADAVRALRGGSWLSDAQYVRAAYRVGYPPDNRDDVIGFRCASSGQASRLVNQEEPARGGRTRRRSPRRPTRTGEAK